MEVPLIKDFGSTARFDNSRDSSERKQLTTERGDKQRSGVSRGWLELAGQTATKDQHPETPFPAINNYILKMLAKYLDNNRSRKHMHVRLVILEHLYLLFDYNSYCFPAVDESNQVN